MNIAAPSIPIEILRTAIMVVEAGTFSKAAVRLGISQPAVSAQMKRLCRLVGGEIFLKAATGSAPTVLGLSMLALARKTLDSHDQILRLSASDAGPERIRLGLSSLLVSAFMIAQSDVNQLNHVYIRSDHAAVLARDLLEERLDLACCLSVGRDTDPSLKPYLIATRDDPMVWVRSAQFVLSPGRPLPIVAWRGDDWITATLTDSGISFRVVFDGEGIEGILAAVEAGQGLTALPAHLVPQSLICAREYYLPALPKTQTKLFARSADRSLKQSVLILLLRQLFIDCPEDILPRQAV